MQRSKMHFEQIPVAVVKKIATEVHYNAVDGDHRAVTRTPPIKSKPHRSPSLGNYRKRV